MDRQVILETEGISYFYEGGKEALKNVSVTIRRGEKIALLGRNGAGKSTFFLNLCGVLKPDSGSILLNGERVKRRNRMELRKQVGIVFQDADSQLVAPTVYSEVAFGPSNLKLSGEEIRRRTKEALEVMRLTKLKDRPPHYLSGGEKRRTAVAGILSMEPRVICFDEPTAALDSESLENLEALLEVMHREGRTLLVSTHDVDFAYRFADRVLVFADGEIAADGSFCSIWENEELLIKTGLRKPLMYQVGELLKARKITEKTEEFPRDLEELTGLLDI